MQRGNLWHFKSAEQENGFPGSSMTFSPNLPKFDRMTQGAVIPTNLKVKGVFCTGLSQSPDWGIVYSWELLQLPAGLLKSLWMEKEPALHVGRAKTRICQDTKTEGEQGDRAVSWAGSKGTERLWSPLSNHLSSHFPFMLLKKTHHPTHGLLVRPGTLPVCRPRCLFAPHPNIPQCFNLSAATVPAHPQRGWAAQRQGVFPPNRIWVSKLVLFNH